MMLTQTDTKPHANSAGAGVGDGSLDDFDGPRAAVTWATRIFSMILMVQPEAFTSQLVEIVTIPEADREAGGRRRRSCAQRSGMKKYIREMIQDLKGSKAKAFIPPVPKGAATESVTDLTPPPDAAMPNDLSNQELSKDPAERVRQLDYQAFQSERRQTNS